MRDDRSFKSVVVKMETSDQISEIFWIGSRYREKGDVRVCLRCLTCWNQMNGVSLMETGCGRKW